MIKGIVRKLDPLGRITLPVDTRRVLGMVAREMIDIYLKGDGIIYVELSDPGKVKGVPRQIDDIGRICLPKEFRRSLKINDSDPVQMYVHGNIICIEPIKLQCVCCGDTNEESLITINDVHMCPNCIKLFGLAVKRNEIKSN